jgi:hypothetical protein
MPAKLKAWLLKSIIDSAQAHYALHSSLSVPCGCELQTSTLLSYHPDIMSSKTSSSGSASGSKRSRVAAHTEVAAAAADKAAMEHALADGAGARVSSVSASAAAASGDAHLMSADHEHVGAKRKMVITNHTSITPAILLDVC